jgi:hypothetical protein
VTANPFGTFTPFAANSRYISPNEAFFPDQRHILDADVLKPAHERPC